MSVCVSVCLSVCLSVCVQVGYVAQQVAKRRSKRSYDPPTDPKFSQEWYLVSAGGSGEGIGWRGEGGIMVQEEREWGGE